MFDPEGKITITFQSLDNILRDLYVMGFFNSSEGYNGECPNNKNLDTLLTNEDVMKDLDEAMVKVWQTIHKEIKND